VGRTHVAADRIAGLEIELADLGGGDINVVRAGQVVVVRGAQEPVAVGKDFKDAVGEDVPFFFTLGLGGMVWGVRKGTCSRREFGRSAADSNCRKPMLNLPEIKRKIVTADEMRPAWTASRLGTVA